jgi:4-amino-4-deoxy-L-arabinose transferase-like glycosyltransferase
MTVPVGLRAVLAYLCVSLPLAFLWLGKSDVHVMEGIVADGVRYMESTRELAVAHLHGEVYNFKPPGAYWMALGSQRLFGVENAWTLRFPFALSGVLMGLVVLWLAGNILGPWGGVRCALATVATRMIIPRLHLAEWDVALAAGVGLAVAVACRNFAATRPSPVLWLLGYLGLTLGFLVKGAPALLLYVPGLLCAALLTGRSRDLLRPAHLAGAALFLLLGGAWVLAAAAAEGWAVFAQPLSEAGAKTLDWTPVALGRALIKPLVFAALILPWSVLLLMIARPGWWRELAPAEKRLAQSAAAFTVAGVALLTLTSAREMRYFLPLAVPMGLLCGMAAGRPLDSSSWSRWTTGTGRGLALLLGVAARESRSPKAPDPRRPGLRWRSV